MVRVRVWVRVRVRVKVRIRARVSVKVRVSFSVCKSTSGLRSALYPIHGHIRQSIAQLLAMGEHVAMRSYVIITAATCYYSRIAMHSTRCGLLLHTL